MNTETMAIKQGKVKGRQLLAVKPKTEALSHQCSATEPQQPDDHQPSQSSIFTS